MEGSTKQTGRLARRDTKIGDLPVKAGTKVLVSLAAGNRDPRRWEDPQAFELGRPRIKEHIAFGRGKHVGQPEEAYSVNDVAKILYRLLTNLIVASD
ncbi:MAG: cytochrome P450 [Novosphingobium sp.]